VDSTCDILEILAAGSFPWKGIASSKDAALVKLALLSENCANELRVIHLPTKAVLASRPPRSQAAGE
jgi:hypothetical protein